MIEKALRPMTRAERAAAEAEEDARLAELPVEARANALLARFGVFAPPIDSEGAQRRLVAMGEAAVGALVAHLDVVATGWQAAHTLAQIGAPGALGAIEALLRHARAEPRSHASMWSAKALARLGRLDAVSALLDQRDKAYEVAAGLAAVTPVSFPWIERALDRDAPEVTAALEEALRPGRGRFFDPSPDGFESALSGCQSAHAMVRKDAVLLLLERAFPKATQPRALAELLRMTRDDDAEVRRLVALSLGRVGKKYAAAAREALELLLRDPVERVRDAARYSVDQHAKK